VQSFYNYQLAHLKCGAHKEMTLTKFT